MAESGKSGGQLVLPGRGHGRQNSLPIDLGKRRETPSFSLQPAMNRRNNVGFRRLISVGKPFEKKSNASPLSEYVRGLYQLSTNRG